MRLRHHRCTATNRPQTRSRHAPATQQNRQTHHASATQPPTPTKPLNRLKKIVQLPQTASVPQRPLALPSIQPAPDKIGFHTPPTLRSTRSVHTFIPIIPIYPLAPLAPCASCASLPPSPPRTLSHAANGKAPANIGARQRNHKKRRNLWREIPPDYQIAGDIINEIYYSLAASASGATSG